MKGGDKVSEAMKRTQIYLPEDLKVWFQRYANSTHTSMAELIRRAADEFIAREKMRIARKKRTEERQ